MSWKRKSGTVLLMMNAVEADMHERCSLLTEEKPFLLIAPLFPRTEQDTWVFGRRLTDDRDVTYAKLARSIEEGVGKGHIALSNEVQSFALDRHLSCSEVRLYFHSTNHNTFSRKAANCIVARVGQRGRKRNDSACKGCLAWNLGV